MVATAVEYNDGPIAFRYPRGEATGIDVTPKPEILEIGKGRVLREGSQIALLSYGTRLDEALGAAKELEALGLSTTVADARFAKPLDKKLILQLADEHEVLITIEEGSIGGFGSFVLHELAKEGRLDEGLKIRSMHLPDEFIDHDTPDKMYEKAKLDSKAIVRTVFETLGQDKALNYNTA
jgi:1-deoxy-D-xylulose-5-phosphate synthase